MATESKAAQRKREAERKRSGSSTRLSEIDGAFTRAALAPTDEVEIKSIPGVPAPAETPGETSTDNQTQATAEKPQSSISRKKKRSEQPEVPGPFASRPPALVLVALHTTRELWGRYEKLAFELAEPGKEPNVSEVVRLVLSNRLPDIETDKGKAEAFQIAQAWSRKRERSAVTPVHLKLRLRMPMVRQLKDLANEARAAGAQLNRSQLICGVLDQSDLNASAIAKLEEI